jgi:arylsulfatase A-like enzyme
MKSLMIKFYIILLLIVSHKLLAEQKIPSKPWNVILVSIDSLRADHMSLYGYKLATTPTIDSWAKEAVVFENYFATSYLTPISELSVHTGLYPFSNGVINFQSTLKPEIFTLAQILKTHGWQTAAIGSSPEFASYPAIKESIARGFDLYNLSMPSLEKFNGRGNDPLAVSIEWLLKARRNSKPFFLWLSLGSVHWPYGQDAPIKFAAKEYNGFLKNTAQQQLSTYGFIFKGKKYQYNPVKELISFDKNVADKDIDYVIGRYDDGILHTDAMLDKLFNYLKKNQLDRNTIVVLQSEHGEGMGERGYILHYDIYDEQVHTPLIIKAPNITARRMSELASGVDVLPTILDLLNLPTPETVEGVSFAPYLLGAEKGPREEVYITRTPLWERVMTAFHYKQLDGFVKEDNVQHFYDTAVRTNQLKLIHRVSRDAQKKWSWLNNFVKEKIFPPEYELYDVVHDGFEKKDLYQIRFKDPDVVDLKNKLNTWEKNINIFKPTVAPEQQIQPYF